MRSRSAFAAEYRLDAALMDCVDWKKLDGMDAPELEELAREPFLMEWPRRNAGGCRKTDGGHHAGRRPRRTP